MMCTMFTALESQVYLCTVALLFKDPMKVVHSVSKQYNLVTEGHSSLLLVFDGSV